VRQGGVLSPCLFCVYMDELSVNAGCIIGSSLINHLMYAEDWVLTALSLTGLSILCSICLELTIFVKHILLYPYVYVIGDLIPRVTIRNDQCSSKFGKTTMKFCNDECILMVGYEYFPKFCT